MPALDGATCFVRVGGHAGLNERAEFGSKWSHWRNVPHLGPMLCRQRLGPRDFAAESRTSYLEPRALPATLGALPGLKGRNKIAQGNAGIAGNALGSGARFAKHPSPERQRREGLFWLENTQFAMFVSSAPKFRHSKNLPNPAIYGKKSFTALPERALQLTAQT